MSEQVSGRSLRKFLTEVLVTDSDLNAFCLDYYPHIYRQFAGGMTRGDKISMLVDKEAADEILKNVRDAEPQRAKRFANLLQGAADKAQDDPPRKAEPVAPVASAQRELSRAELLNALKTLVAAQFEEVEFLMNLNPGHVAANTLPQGQRAMQLIRLAEQDTVNGLKRLTEALEQVRGTQK